MAKTASQLQDLYQDHAKMSASFFCHKKSMVIQNIGFFLPIIHVVLHIILKLNSQSTVFSGLFLVSIYLKGYLSSPSNTFFTFDWQLGFFLIWPSEKLSPLIC